MAIVRFTSTLDRFVACDPQCASGETVAQALQDVFTKYPNVQHYILDDQDQLRKHVVVFLDGQMIDDRVNLTDAVGTDSEIYVMQALSGG